MKNHIRIALALVACLAAAITSYAAVILDDNGNGFVGKGDVQTVFGWNNTQLQNNAAGLTFEYNADSIVVTERSWICTNTNNENTQERDRTTTTTMTVSHPESMIARVKNQITGFNLTAGVGTSSSSSSTEGPMLNSCPGGPWALTTPAGDPVEISNETTRVLTVCSGGVCHDIAVD
jgi:hypothetical protein